MCGSSRPGGDRRRARGAARAAGLALIVVGMAAAATATTAAEATTTGTPPPGAAPAAAERPDFDALWDYDHPDSTEARFRTLLPLARRAGDASYLAQLLTQIARTQGLQRRFQAAHRTLDEVPPLIEDEVSIAGIRYLLERGRVYNSAGHPAQARPRFVEAWNKAQELGADAYAVDAAHMVAIVDPPESALDWNLKALALAEQSDDARARRWLGSLYNNIGWTYHDQHRYEQALATFEKALAWRQEHHQAAEIRIARWCVARTLRSLGRLEEALAMQRALGEAYAQLGEHDGYVDEELGECLLALGRADEATPHFAAAYAQLSQDPWLAESEPQRIERLRRLGRAAEPSR